MKHLNGAFLVEHLTTKSWTIFMFLISSLWPVAEGQISWTQQVFRGLVPLTDISDKHKICFNVHSSKPSP